MEISVDTRELVELERRLALAGNATEKNIGKVLKTIGLVVQGKAKALCPISPSTADINASLKRIKKTTRIVSPGGLTNSIQVEVKADSVEIGVPSNTPGGDYAERIHDEKGKTWQNLGVGSVRKGATDKFIFKAQEATEDEYLRAVDTLVDKIVDAI